MARRLLGVPTLYSKLPKGTEGGKEFGRVVNLLLFYEGISKDKNVRIFNDSAGDYRGLDSFDSELHIKNTHIGYQYKFFPSPLSSTHRKEIIHSLNTATKSNNIDSGQLKKWILVTPEDFVESSTKKDGGDVTWFENLKSELNLTIEIEHWGHTKIQALFIKNPSICLFYYPELVVNGSRSVNQIKNIRKKYDDNLKSLYENIEFVGMSIYKAEATRGVPMEHIYIPLKVIRESDDDQLSNKYFDPINFLSEGSRSVILGDPGSGKSTLLRFLAIKGISEKLQKRYKTVADNRLPIVITLRRYTDELKARKNLSIFEYILESIKADFNLNGFDQNFLEYYLETGQTLLFFDGLDELPDPNYKVIMRDRIKSFITVYPGNNLIVTSRIVGYDNAFRFDDRNFNHYKVAKLQLPEIEQFVRDWYKVRIDNEKERKISIDDLIRILSDNGHISIRELAENPLLLTIVALVHRIDAVLPDERVILYQKCTETLLNTWHTWKFRDTDVKNKGKVERRNRRRMEVIAKWMHEQSTGTGSSQRSVVPHAEILRFLTNHISINEQNNEYEIEAEDVATDFLEFIKKRAGLLIEVGDQSYSFVHLTFQEYLTSSCLITDSEKDGIVHTWNDIAIHSDDTRWYEVIRLFIAGLKSDKSQEYLIMQLLLHKDHVESINPILLGGLLLDGVIAAEDKKTEILTLLFSLNKNVNDLDYLKSVISIVKAWISKEVSHEDIVKSVLIKLITKTEKNKSTLILLTLCLNISKDFNQDVINLIKENVDENSNYIRLFFSNNDSFEENQNAFLQLELLQNIYAVTSAHKNLLSICLLSISLLRNFDFGVKSLYQTLLMTIITGSKYGPFKDFINNFITISSKSENNIFYNFDLNKKPSKKYIEEFDNKIEQVFKSTETINLKITSENMDLIRTRLSSEYSNGIINHSYATETRSTESRDVYELVRINRNKLWELFITTPKLYSPLLVAITKQFNLFPVNLWNEALRINYLTKIPAVLNLFSHDKLDFIIDKFHKGIENDSDADYVGSLLLIGIWLKNYNHDIEFSSLFTKIFSATNSSKFPKIKIAISLYEIAHGNIESVEKFKGYWKTPNKNFRKIFKSSYWNHIYN